MPYIEVIKVFNEMVSHLKFFSLNIFFGWMSSLVVMKKNMLHAFIFSLISNKIYSNKKAVYGGKWGGTERRRGTVHVDEQRKRSETRPQVTAQNMMKETQRGKQMARRTAESFKSFSNFNGACQEVIALWSLLFLSHLKDF